MTQDDIICMAREVDLVPNWMQNIPENKLEYIKRFATLVAAAKEEEMESQGWRQCAVGQRTTQFCGATEAAIKKEREECVSACQVERESYRGTGWGKHAETIIDNCIDAIRARGNK